MIIQVVDAAMILYQDHVLSLAIITLDGDVIEIDVTRGDNESQRCHLSSRALHCWAHFMLFTEL